MKFRSERSWDGPASYRTPDTTVWVGGLYSVREAGVSTVVRRDVESGSSFKLKLAWLFASPRLGILENIVPVPCIADVKFKLPQEDEVRVHIGKQF